MGQTRARPLDIALFERACAAHPFGRSAARPGSRHEARNDTLDDLFCAGATSLMLFGSSSLRRCLKVLGSPMRGNWALTAALGGAPDSHFEHASGNFARPTSGVARWGLHFAGADLGSRVSAQVVGASFTPGAVSQRADRGATLPRFGASVSLSSMPPART